MSTNNPKQKRYIAPEMMALIIRTERLCSTSQTQTETATRENYTSIDDLFD